jgi:nitrite reductase (cytochrome c-552)
VRLVEVNELTTDPEPWGMNWPRQYDGYKRTVDMVETEYGGSSGMTQQKLDAHPWLRRMYSGYAFAIDYREARGHAYMLSDQLLTKRVTEKPQPGACLHCHSSVIPTYRRLGLEAMNLPADDAALQTGTDWPAVMKGFEVLGAMSYADAHAELLKTSDGTAVGGSVHPVSCVDCHEPESMRSRVTRPGFVKGIAALAASDEPMPQFPSIQRWRDGNRATGYDPNVLASRQEMRTFVCAQCHVEYYCGPKETLFFPWGNGLKAEQIEELYDTHTFPSGEAFHDYKHGETGASIYKAQHPEFELWSQGVHSRSGVSCADCHMPYERQGATKVSSHWVKSPLLSINSSCQPCHNVSEDELREKVQTIQGRTRGLIERAAVSVTDMLDAIRDAKASGASDEQLAPALALQRKSQWRLDFISSENSDGFHADQEAARILAEAIDYARQAQVLAQAIRTPAAPASTTESAPVEGVTPTEQAPKRPSS